MLKRLMAGRSMYFIILYQANAHYVDITGNFCLDWSKIKNTPIELFQCSNDYSR